MYTKKLIVVLILSFGALLMFFAMTVGAQPEAIIDNPLLVNDVLPVLQGRVFEGPIGVETVPLSGTTVALFGANNPYPDTGNLISVTSTDATGWYGFPVNDQYEFYRIQEIDPPGKISVGARSVSGTVKTANWIQYETPLAGKVLTGNKFWDKPRPIIWEKWIDDEAWTPQMDITRQTSDTIKVVDVIRGWPTDDLKLVEHWNPAHLELLDWSIQPINGAVVSNPDELIITLPEGDRVYTVTKYFHVEPCNWEVTTLDERVLFGNELRDVKPVQINKFLPQLWIVGPNSKNVYAGDVISFVLEYGNQGGYENDVMIRNTFPVTAPFVHADPPPDRQAEDGTWVEWDVGDLASDNTGIIEVLVAIDESLPPSSTIWIYDWIYNHVRDEVGVTELMCHVEPRPPDLIWEKTVNGVPYDPDWVVTVETSDAIEIVDVIVTPRDSPVILTERWDPGQLELINIIPNPDPGTIIVGPGRMEASLPGGSQVYTLTKLFHVQPCTWRVTFIEELLSKPDSPQPWVRTVPIQKVPPELWISSAYDADVIVGEPATFELQYGNTGGRESFAYIRNEFPEIARFAGSDPPPNRVGPGGMWAEWDLGPLDNGVNKTIQVTVGIAPQLPPSTTIVIWDGIFNHAGELVGEVFTEFHVPRPPVTFPDGDWPWYAQEEITVFPEPPIAGQPTELCAEVVNHDLMNDHAVMLEFSVSKLGIGLPFHPVGTAEVLVPAGGAQKGCVMWIPPAPEHWCIQVRIIGERYPLQISRRNVDVDEPLTSGVTHDRMFVVSNPFEHPVTVTLGLVPHLQDWGLELSQDVIPDLHPGTEHPFTLTVTPPDGKPLPPDGTVIVDVEAFVGESLLGGIRKIYRPPVILHHFPDPFYAEREITVHPYPPRAGEPTEICVELRNPTSFSQAVNVWFLWAKFGIGIPFTPIDGMRPVHLPAHSVVKECIYWIPPVGGHVCLQVLVEMENHLPQRSQRNIDINEVLKPGFPNTLVFPVGNPTQETVTLTLGLIPHLPGWGLELNPDTIHALPAGQTVPVSLTVTPPQDVELPSDGTTIVDVEGYIGGEIIGGIRKIYRPPIPIHRPKDPVYAESEIGVDPYPVIPGEPVKLSVEVFNPTNQDQLVTATFAIADFGIGLPFSIDNIAPNPIRIFVPAHGAARGHTIWTPPPHRWGKFCIEVTLEIPGHPPIWSRRNIDVGEPLRPGIPHALDFLVGSWPHTGPVTVELGLITHKPGWDISLSDVVLTNVDKNKPLTVTLTVTPPKDIKLGTGMPIVDVEAYVEDKLLGGFRKVDIPPIPLHKPYERTYAESEISIDPYPPKLGVDSLVSTVIQNAMPNTTTINLEFGWAKFGVGIPFTSTGMAPPTRTVELGPLMAVTSTVTWTPEIAGHQCVLVKLNDAEGLYEEQWSQRNVDVERTPPCGETKTFTFTVYNDSPVTVTIYIGMITFNVPANWQVTVNPTGTVEIAKFSSMVIEVTVNIPCPMTLNAVRTQRDIAAIQAAAGSVPTIDVEAYKEGDLVGGIEIVFDDSLAPDYNLLYLPVVVRNP